MTTALKIRLHFDASDMLGPGKADLLERIRDVGSIAAAARDIGMSYKRAWQLVNHLNAMFDTPLIAGTRGGIRGGGAILTERGHLILALYRQIEASTQDATRKQVEVLESYRTAISDQR